MKEKLYVFFFQRRREKNPLILSLMYSSELELIRKGTNGGGADRDRTGDPRLAKPVLSQLSYSPVSFARSGYCERKETPAYADERSCLVGHARLELATSPLSGVRSNHLS